MFAVTLTIAGSDPSGGAGIQADLKTFHQHQTYGCSVITLITVQNTLQFEAVEVLKPSLVLAQLKTVLEDFSPAAAKTGALGNAEVAEALSLEIAKFEFPLIVDPVLVSKHGSLLLDPDGENILRKKIIPHAFLLTPNLYEASRLAERDVFDLKSMEQAAISIGKLGAKNVLIKGGHLESQAIDLLYSNNEFYQFPYPKINTKNTHGTGCTYSAAITAQIAKKRSLLEAVKISKEFINQAILEAPGLGKGFGPVNHFVKPGI